MAIKPVEGKEEAKGDVKIEKPPTTGAGFKIERPPAEIEPPLAPVGEGEEERLEEEIAAKKVTGKMPIMPAMIKPPLRFEGLMLTELTGWAGWIYSEEDLEDIATMIAECGWEMDPRFQVLFSMVGLHGAKFIGYQAWKRAGSKGDLRKKETKTGELPKKKVPPGEEVKG